MPFERISRTTQYANSVRHRADEITISRVPHYADRSKGYWLVAFQIGTNILKRLGNPERLDVLYGTEGDKGKVLFVPSDEGMKLYPRMTHAEELRSLRKPEWIHLKKNHVQNLCRFTITEDGALIVLVPGTLTGLKTDQAGFIKRLSGDDDIITPTEVKEITDAIVLNAAPVQRKGGTSYLLNGAPDVPQHKIDHVLSSMGTGGSGLTKHGLYLSAKGVRRRQELVNQPQ